MNELHSLQSAEGDGATGTQKADQILIAASNLLWKGKILFMTTWLLLKGSQKGNISDCAFCPNMLEPVHCTVDQSQANTNIYRNAALYFAPVNADVCALSWGAAEYGACLHHHCA